ncbi:reverse transcriptase [Gossypium australe]|uniref:Reverse transcriptase n=1 Tax=Gossypium australe TaxID=47621 RepID=A0A5B6VPQ3_9ROSI|nr:reverse transcriptase [Gossypium australe]
MKTKLSQQRMSKTRRSCGFINGIDVDAEGSRGGLCLAWRTGMDVTLKSFSKWHIDVMVKEDGSQAEWRFTGFYSSPYSKDQNQVWDLLKILSQNGTGPWLVIGDFNEIMYSFEKKRGLPRDQRRMEIFRETLTECQLTDIGFSGASFTWERGNLLETNIRERLDRGVANDEWISLFPMGRVQHLPFSTSDHCPLLINTVSVNSYSRHHRFHFEVWWTMEESFEEVLRGIWESSSEPLMEKLKSLQNGLEEWAGVIKRKKGELKKKLSQELEMLLLEERDDETLARIIDTKIHLNMEIEKD